MAKVKQQDVSPTSQAETPAPNPDAVLTPNPDVRHARVTIPNTHVGTIEVSIPADAENPITAAIEAAKQLRGVVSFGAGPQVEFLD